jgi:uncharacterized RDD family membrane protein YckC
MAQSLYAGAMTSSDTTSHPATPPRPAPLVGWRLFALLYDFFPVLGLWFATGAVAMLVHGGEPIYGDTLAGWLELCALWLVTGLYATLSWRRGGQTLGMRPWRLHLTAREGGEPSWPQLWTRYAVGALSLLLGGIGFWWAWVDREKLTWHDRASRTRLIRLPKQ